MNLGIQRAFVRESVICSLDSKNLSCSFLAITYSRTKWQLISICLVRTLNIRIDTRNVSSMLSHQSIGEEGRKCM
jgi:hypothetical protein